MGTVCPCVLKPSQFAFLIQQIPTEISHINQSSLVAVGGGGSCRGVLRPKSLRTTALPFSCGVSKEGTPPTYGIEFTISSFLA